MKKIAFVLTLLFALLNLVYAQIFSHPRDQIALQLGAIQMGYPVPFALTEQNPTNAQQAANAIAMGRNALDATLSNPTLKVQGVLNSPAVDSVDFRDQLYKAVEAVVTAPVVGSVKGSVILQGGKKLKVTATLVVPLNSHTIPVPFAVEAAYSLDAQYLATDVTNLSNQVSSVSGNLSKTEETVSTLAGNLNAANNSISNLSSQYNSVSGNLSKTEDSVSTLAGNLTAAKNSISTLSGNMENLFTEVAAVKNNSTSSAKQLDKLDYMKNALVAQGVILDYAPCSVNALERFMSSDSTDFLHVAGLEFDSQGGILVSANYAQFNTQNYYNSQGNYEYGLVLNISSSGNVTTLAGGAFDKPVDGMVDTAQFALPNALAVDANRNVYVGDGGSIRKITPSGQVTTLVGSWLYGSADGFGSLARFENIDSMVVDFEGNIYAADDDGYKLRKVTPAGVVTTLYESEYDSIHSLIIDSAGNLYFEHNEIIRKVTPAGVVSNLAGGGPNVDGAGLQASFNYIQSMVIDSAGNIYVAESDRIRKVTPAGVVTTLAGGGPTDQGYVDGTGLQASFEYIDRGNMVIDSADNLYVADDNRIRKVTTAGVVTTLAGSEQEGFADGAGTAASFYWIRSLAMDSGGSIYVADYNYSEGISKIRKVALTGVVSSIEGSEEIVVYYPYYKLVSDSLGNIFVTQEDEDDGYAPEIWKISSSGTISTIGNPTSSLSIDGINSNARFGRIQGSVKDEGGNLYVAEYDRIRKVTPAGEVTTLAGGGSTDQGYVDGTGLQASFDYIRNMAIDSVGNLYVTEYDRIRKVTPAGVVTTLAGGGPEDQGAVDGTGTQTSFYEIFSMIIDSTDNIYVAEYDRIRKVTTSGEVTTLAGGETRDRFGNGLDGIGVEASFCEISCIVVNDEGNLYVADRFNIYDGDQGRIRKVTTSGVVTTVAGKIITNQEIEAADGVAKNAAFGLINNLVIDGKGGLFVFESNRIRHFTADNRVKTLVGNANRNSEEYESEILSKTLPNNMLGFEYEFNDSLYLPKVDASGNIYVVDHDYVVDQNDMYKAQATILKMTTQ